jgi:N-acetylglucosaminyldiphosphoundecaprenol N-acetyl-beta-D-mannosaminyltransferase
MYEHPITFQNIRTYPLGLSDAFRLIIGHIGKVNGIYFCFLNVHLISEAQRDNSLKQVLNESAGNFPDGMGVALALKFLGYHFKGRVRGADLVLMLCKFASTVGLRIFLLGSTGKNLVTLKRQLQDSYKGLNIVGAISPPFRPLSKEEDKRIIDQINNSEADILLVSLGAPKQERWMHEHRGKIRPIQLGVGAAFDFITGAVRQAPHWMQNVGFEWLYRLPQQPRKTTSRMLLAPGFLLKTIIEVSRKRQENNAT